MARFSGLQRDVLALYRQCLRAVKEKPVDAREHFRDFARSEFQKNISLNKKDFSAIEYMLRAGRRKLDTYKDPEIKDVHRNPNGVRYV